MKKEIETNEDIKLLIDSFYEKVKTNKIIGYFFTDVANINWEKHLPIMYNFWENTLFYTGTYEGNPMELHKHLHKTMPLTKAHFREWTTVFCTTVDELFAGKNANLAKQRAVSIATVMQIKIISNLSSEEK